MAPQSVPPPLPPSVEEAYRRKCVQLRNRTNEVEDANDASRLRLARIKRQVEKLRIERAFLLEQLTKRTSTNVEDSEGSPSPPPVDFQLDFASKLEANATKPQDKPLRNKRGHRKSAIGDAEAAQSTPGVSFDAPHSPTEDPETQTQQDGSQANGTSDKGKATEKPFDLFSKEKREEVAKELEGKDDADVEKELTSRWEALSQEERDAYAKTVKEESKKKKQVTVKVEESKKDDEEEQGAEKKEEEKSTPAEDEDVEMGEKEADDQPETKTDKEEDN